MSCKPLIVLNNRESTSITVGNTIPFPIIVRRREEGIQQSNDTITIVNNRKSNYYEVSVTITFTAPVTGTAIIRLYQNGVAIPGALIASTVNTATTEYNTISLDTVIRTYCQDCLTTLTLVVDGIDITIQNAIFKVKQV